MLPSTITKSLDKIVSNCNRVEAEIATGFAGLWHIREMELWDEDYFNMEVQAYEASGSGWLKLKDADTLEGKIKLHYGDSSLFSAERA